MLPLTHSSTIIAKYAVLQYSLLFSTAVSYHHCRHSICSHCQGSLKCQIKCNLDIDGECQIFKTNMGPSQNVISTKQIILGEVTHDEKKSNETFTKIIIFLNDCE